MGTLSTRAKQAILNALTDDSASREIIAAINQGEALPIPEASVQSLVTDLAAKAADSTVVHLAGIETITGTKTFSTTITGSITGNAGTTTNGVVTTGSYSDPAWVASLAGSKLTGSVLLPARRNTRRTATNGLPIVTNRLGALGSGTYSNVGTDTGCTSKIAHKCTQVLSCVRFIYSNWHMIGGAAEGSPGNAITVAASIEYPSGTKTRLYFGGAASVTIADGGQATSDPIWVSIPANTVFWSNSYVSCTSAQRWYFSRQMIPGLPEASNAQYAGGNGTDQTAPGTATLSAGSVSTYMFGPSVIIGTTATTGAEPVSVGGLGDSILAGVGRSVSSAGNVGSWFERGLGGSSPAVSCINLGQGSAKMSDAATLPGGFKQRLALLSSCDYVICNFGINDLGGTPSTLAQLQANALIVWGYLSLQGIRVYQATLCPNTSSTDTWATLANQTVRATEATRTGFNTWIRGGAPTSAGVAVAVGTGGALVAGQSGHQLTGYIDIASKVEVDAANAATLNGGLWSVGSVYTTDGLGVHPSEAGHILCATAINTAVFVAY